MSTKEWRQANKTKINATRRAWYAKNRATEVPRIKMNEPFSWLVAVAIFFVYVVLDSLAAYYTTMVADKKPIAAANAGAFMYFLMAVGIINIVNNFWYTIPVAVGSWVGTYAVVAWQGNHDK